MADPTMADVVSFFRQKGVAAEDDVFGGITYWTDEQLETILLQHSRLMRVKMKGRNKLHYQLDSHKAWMFDSEIEFSTLTGDEVNGTGVYTPASGQVLFDEEQDETVVFATGRAFNIYDALADLWDQKAAQRESYVDFRAGHNTMELSQSWKHCVAQRDYYRAKTIRSWRR